jgi:hypothetical protein
VHYPVSGIPQPKGVYTLGQRPFDTRPPLIALLPFFTPIPCPRTELTGTFTSEQIPNRLILHVISCVPAAEPSSPCHPAQVLSGIVPLCIGNALNHGPLVPLTRPGGIGLALAYLTRVLKHQEYAIRVWAGAEGQGIEERQGVSN